MSIFEYVMSYLVVWWVCLFAVLPFFYRRAESLEAGQYHAAPKNVPLARILLTTSVVAIFVTGAFAWTIQQESILAWLEF